MEGNINPRKAFGLGLVCVLLLVFLISLGKIVESVDANKIVVIQDVGSGRLRFFITAGWKLQKFGTVTRYPKRANYNFAYPVRFNDGGHGTMFGSIQFDFPTSDSLLTLIHTRFHDPQTFQSQLIEKVVNKAMYMTGPLMSSRESYAERRNDLIRFVEDQVQNGVYRTRSRETRVLDPITGQEKTAVVVEIVMANGVPERQEQSVLQIYGVTTSNFSLDSLPYDSIVERQIQQQQQLTMQVQTSMAQARQAEQQRITAEQEGQATTTMARWRQEAVKVESVTVAQRRFEVARYDAQAADQERIANIRRGEGEGARRRLAMQADGALQQKLEALVQINRAWADAAARYTGSWVPQVVMGGDGSSRGSSGANDFMQLLTMQAARQIGLDMRVPNRVAAPVQAQTPQNR